MMLPEQRRLKILEFSRKTGVPVSAILVKLDVSELTIRQDLEKFSEVEGYIIREHGGAFLKSIPQQVGSMSLQHQENMDKKVRIGKKASEFIHDWDAIIIDSGLTTTEVAKIFLKNNT